MREYIDIVLFIYRDAWPWLYIVMIAGLVIAPWIVGLLLYLDRP